MTATIDATVNPARFDVRKAEAINAEHVRRLPAAELPARLLPYLQAAEVLPDPPDDAQRALLAAASPLVQTRMQLLGEAPGMLGFLFVADGELPVDADALALLAKDPEVSTGVLRAAIGALTTVAPWTAESIDLALRAAIVDGLGLKPKVAFTPLRVAVTGRRVSPPLWESMELLGRDSTLARIARLAGLAGLAG